jgi:hypothetical protein
VDITELILSDHHEMRRMFALLDDMDPSDRQRLSAVWRRLAVLLDVHADAEEQVFYPQVLKVGTGAGGKDSAGAETEDAVHDHNEIRDAVREVGHREPGSDEWWEAVSQAREANGDHMAEEEREALPDFRRHAGLDLRHRLAVEFAALEAANAGGIDSEDKNPSGYVEDRS